MLKASASVATIAKLFIGERDMVVVFIGLFLGWGMFSRGVPFAATSYTQR